MTMLSHILSDLSKQVVADKMLKKTLETYAASGRKLLVITSFDNIENISGSFEIMKKLENNPELVEILKNMFVDEAPEDNLKQQEDTSEEIPIEDIFEENQQDKSEESETNHTTENNEEKTKLYTNKTFHLPKLVCPFKDKHCGWNKHVARDQTLLYLNVLNYGCGGEHTLKDTKHKKAEKPKWWPNSLNMDKYPHPSQASISANEDIIESILQYYGYDISTHCHTRKQFKQLGAKKRKAKKTLSMSIVEDDPSIVSVDFDSDKARPRGTSTSRKHKKYDLLEDEAEITNPSIVVVAPNSSSSKENYEEEIDYQKFIVQMEEEAKREREEKSKE
jgi:hypothetical protein